MDKRYGNYTAPYGLQLHGRYSDGALHRGLGTMVNHKRHANAFLRGTNGGEVETKRRIDSGEFIDVSYGSDYRFSEPTKHWTK